jgi:hypothetical protein
LAQISHTDGVCQTDLAAATLSALWTRLLDRGSFHIFES